MLAAFAALSVLSTTSCSTATRLAGGQALGYQRHERTAYGAELLARTAAGSSDGTTMSALEATARLLATRQTQALGVGFGPAGFLSFGRGLASVNLTPLLGVGRFDTTFIGMATFHAATGFGIALERNVHVTRPVVPELGIPNYVMLASNTTALTFEVSGSADLPFTRAPQYSLGFLLGVAWLDQSYSEYREGANPNDPDFPVITRARPGAPLLLHAPCRAKREPSSGDTRCPP